MDFTLRDFQSTDFEMLWRIDQECFPPGIAYSKAELSAYIESAAAFAIVAEIASRNPRLRNQVSTAEAASSGPSSALSWRMQIEMESVTLLQSTFFPRGVATALAAPAEGGRATASEFACDRVRLETSVDNAAAQKFYERHGYAVVKTIPRILLEWREMRLCW